MATITEHLDVPPDAVTAVMADGWSYAAWVVGASRVREVDTTWPAEGSRIHHSVGPWPAVIDDTTSVVESKLDGSSRRLKLQARAWPAGEATVLFEFEADGAGTRVTLTEDATKGPGVLMPRPVRSVLLKLRNRETLRRLGMLARGRARETGRGDRPGRQPGS